MARSLCHVVICSARQAAVLNQEFGNWLCGSELPAGRDPAVRAGNLRPPPRGVAGVQEALGLPAMGGEADSPVDIQQRASLATLPAGGARTCGKRRHGSRSPRALASRMCSSRTTVLSEPLPGM